MGIYLNPNNETFTRILKREIYVDKTMMIKVINRFMETDNTYICVSRPRRFGKTFAGNMLSAYFSRGCDSRKLFEPYKISRDPSFESNLNKLNVIKIDVNSEFKNERDTDNLLNNLQDRIVAEFIEQFPDLEFNPKESVGNCILKAYSKKNEHFVVIMDEYDVLVRENVSPNIIENYLDFLSGLFKSSTLSPAIELAYLTGVLPIVRDRHQTRLNNFSEFSMLNAGKFAEFIGFTDSEVKSFCRNQKANYAQIKDRFGGYFLNQTELYSPESVVASSFSTESKNFFNESFSSNISKLLNQYFAGMKDDVIKMVAGESVDVNVTTFMNTMTEFRTKDDVFTYLIHLGYLAYDNESETCRIPNKEVLEEWKSAVAVVDEYKTTDRIIKASKELLKETLKMNEDAVAKALDESHIHVTSNRSYNNEDALQSAIYLSYIYALNKYTILREVTTGKGFADVVFIPFVPDLPAMIVELKRNGSTESALEQIKERRYFSSLEHYSGNLLFVGVNYDEEKKTHECRIERFVKE